MMQERRLLTAAALFTVLGSTLVDPYTWFGDASDFVMPAPTWQTALGLANAALLIGSLVLMWRKRYGKVLAVLVGEFSFNVALNLIYLDRDGLQRFSHGFAGEQYLSWYLLFLLLRVWVIAGVARFRNGSDADFGSTE